MGWKSGGYFGIQIKEKQSWENIYVIHHLYSIKLLPILVVSEWHPGTLPSFVPTQSSRWQAAAGPKSYHSKDVPYDSWPWRILIVKMKGLK